MSSLLTSELPMLPRRRRAQTLRGKKSDVRARAMRPKHCRAPDITVLKIGKCCFLFHISANQPSSACWSTTDNSHFYIGSQHSQQSQTHSLTMKRFLQMWMRVCEWQPFAGLPREAASAQLCSNGQSNPTLHYSPPRRKVNLEPHPIEWKPQIKNTFSWLARRHTHQFQDGGHLKHTWKTCQQCQNAEKSYLRY